MSPITAGQSPLGVLLLHGFSGGPSTFTSLEPALRPLGLPLAVPRLRGHGEASPQGLAGIIWADWLADATSALATLRAALGAGAGAENGSVIVVGHSMGALLALLLAAEQPGAIDSLVLVATPLQLGSPLAPGRPLGGLVPLLGRLLRRWPLPKDYVDAALAASDPSYPWVPMDALLSFLELIGVARRRLPEVKQPALILHSTADRVVAPAAANLLAAEIGSPSSRVRTAWFERSGHELFRDVEQDAVIDAVVAFVSERIRLASGG
ncbi:carboxylesterase [Cyanobium sp. LEGE 06113]|uniref:alpha/beta hydrolase n=1 Tax=Cyanobium sp. LEGE 06113 TaxID=1297573 RepID=UPI00188207D3|nr:alpha/beta fold hydrolase [Cyanobium sp. LEGE 06113]MBE9153638.1 alpha/beta fold hydrolase [Cyanobium sp. LEGE 06113]